MPNCRHTRTQNGPGGNPIGAVPSCSEWSAGAGPPAAQHLETLGQDLLEVLDRPALEQHVPVGARGLDLLGSGLGAADQLGRGAVELALPGVGNFGVVSEGHREQVARRAAVLGVLPLDRRRVPLGLVADAAQAAAPKRTLRHGTPSSHWCWFGPGLDALQAGATHRSGDSRGPTTEVAKRFRRSWF